MRGAQDFFILRNHSFLGLKEQSSAGEEITSLILKLYREV